MPLERPWLNPSEALRGAKGRALTDPALGSDHGSHFNTDARVLSTCCRCRGGFGRGFAPLRVIYSSPHAKIRVGVTSTTTESDGSSAASREY